MLSAALESLFRPDELAAMVKVKFSGRKGPKRDMKDKDISSNDFIYAALDKVSRSFAVVIQQLPEQLKDAVCIFYLVLRGLDTVEDDTAIDIPTKIPILKAFHTHLTKKEGWNTTGYGYKDEKTLLERFEHVIFEYQKLEPMHQVVISEICEKMANGMCEFLEGKSVTSYSDYNLYCHYVAGLVGIGLSKLFSYSGLESMEVAKNERLANSMGLFLQKTNIIRDYLEDLVDNRTWWPQTIWGQYAKRLADLRDPTCQTQLACLNHMIADALGHTKDVIEYMKLIKDTKIFIFCAIPQVMAIATLSKLYNNPKVFKGVVKIRKGLSCKLMLSVTSMDNLLYWIDLFSQEILRNLNARDVRNSEKIRATLTHVQDLCEQYCTVPVSDALTGPHGAGRKSEDFALASRSAQCAGGIPFVLVSAFAFLLFYAVFSIVGKDYPMIGVLVGSLAIYVIVTVYLGWQSLRYLPSAKSMAASKQHPAAASAVPMKALGKEPHQGEGLTARRKDGAGLYGAGQATIQA